jgi:hypothetical protein
MIAIKTKIKQKTEPSKVPDPLLSVTAKQSYWIILSPVFLANCEPKKDRNKTETVQPNPKLHHGQHQQQKQR